MGTSVEREELEQLLEAVDAFTAKIFDAVTPLNRVDFLHQVYDFRNSVETKMRNELST